MKTIILVLAVAAAVWWWKGKPALPAGADPNTVERYSDSLKRDVRKAEQTRDKMNQALEKNAEEMKKALKDAAP
jgi:hypothetical protein